MYFGDPLRVGQILINLVNNAIKFTQNGQIELSIDDIGDDIVQFAIKDTGIGISEEEQINLFQSFSQADVSTTRKYGGTGLGLSISKQLIELMEGEIKVESELDKGSKFSFYIKLPKGVEDEVEKDERTDNVIYLKTKMKNLKTSNILLVEDNEMNKEIICSLLDSFNLNIDIASNGQEALEMFIANQNKYSLILMDIQMPVMDGYEASQRIRELDKTIPIIALSANATLQDIEKSLSHGMNTHINKPIEIEKLYGIFVDYIDQCENIEQSKVKETDISKIDFENIDVKKGLYHVGDNKKLYTKILKRFFEDYSNKSFNEINDDNFLIDLHTLKGLSGNIGALTLYDNAKELEVYQSEYLLNELNKELDRVILELADIDFEHLVVE
ncbi:MAG: ATP-binding protein [Campylobacterota bacterium]|nr:ATP-binding protein [Campylobacterota bacterium]